MDKNKMLIDATHSEETRVVAVRNGRVEEFDFESAARKLLRGNIYLAKVTRVEPSLQAAFIDYGGNRHGFLAFNEIHPDYYQIPIADRELLKQEEAEAEQRAEAELDERTRSRGSRRRRRGRGDRSNAPAEQNGQSAHEARDDLEPPADVIETFEDGYRTSGPDDDETEAPEAAPASAYRHAPSPDDALYAEPTAATEPEAHSDTPYVAAHEEHRHEEYREADAETAAPMAAENAAPQAPVEPVPVAAEAPLPEPASQDPVSHDYEPYDEPAVPAGPVPPPVAYPRAARRQLAIEVETSRLIEIDEVDEDDDTDTDGHGAPDDETVEQVTNEEDALEEVPERPRRRARQYKIQEVIKRRQIMLVQVVKEERGNKGAALTTYISLAGRYTVLMPNTARGGGISRKITQPQDRKRLKAIAEELDVPEGMGLIIRTAGAARTKQEIKRDYEYLLRLWESVRELTLSSTAPSLVYEEGNIIKRAIRDLYSKDFDQIIVAGDVAHREAQDFMEMLMPGSGNHVVNYRAPEPLFARYGVERQLNALFSPYVTLRSGGYIVINQTEALVSVDVNSGKSTREFSIEETALNTNLEAAEEITRQLKLRDLAGLIVIDFIDMEEKRNNRSVERRLKDALRHDRARIQVGRISHFGLLEMSRQRLRAGVLEGSTSQCPHCQGTGIIRSIESVALAVLRGLEDQLLKQPSSLVATATAEVALYILNHKRAYITEMERRHGVVIRVEASDRMQGASFGVERIATPATVKPAARPAVSMEWGFDRDEDAGDDADEVVAEAEAAADEPREGGETRHAQGEAGSDEERRGRRRRRRRGRRDREGDPREDGAHADASGEPHDDDTADDNGHAVAASAANDMDATAEAGAEEAGESAEAAGEGHGDEAGGETRRRGRRRGRRGGRSRRREGEGEAQVAGDDTDGHEWGVAEFARPGAEQPSTDGQDDRTAHAIHLVSSVEVDGGEVREHHAVRTTIVESTDGADSSFAYASEDTVGLAATQAGGAPDEPVAAPDAAIDAPYPAPDAVIEAPHVEIAEATAEPAAPPVSVAAENVADEAIVIAESNTDAPALHAEAPAPETTATPEEAPVEMPAAIEPPAAVETVPVAESVAEPALEDTPSPAATLCNGYDGHHAQPDEPAVAEAHEHAPAEVAARAPEPAAPARKGWWQRRFGTSD